MWFGTGLASIDLGVAQVLDWFRSHIGTELAKDRHQVGSAQGINWKQDVGPWYDGVLTSFGLGQKTPDWLSMSLRHIGQLAIGLGLT